MRGGVVSAANWFLVRRCPPCLGIFLPAARGAAVGRSLGGMASGLDGDAVDYIEIDAKDLGIVYCVRPTQAERILVIQFKAVGISNQPSAIHTMRISFPCIVSPGLQPPASDPPISAARYPDAGCRCWCYPRPNCCESLPCHNAVPSR